MNHGLLVHKEIIMRYLFTGTGRCGTGYVASMMNGIGFHGGHEVMFSIHNQNTREWLWSGQKYQRDMARTEWAGVDFESSWLAVPWLSMLMEEGLVGVESGAQIVWITRNGELVLDSLYRTLHGKWEEFAFAYTPKVYELGHTRAALVLGFYLEWCERLRAVDIVRVHIEHFDSWLINRWPEKEETIIDLSGNRNLRRGGRGPFPWGEISDVGRGLFYEMQGFLGY
jgi:hypothetical protein